jgi:WD40-like Beta Propeller Repeat
VSGFDGGPAAAANGMDGGPASSPSTGPVQGASGGTPSLPASMPGGVLWKKYTRTNGVDAFSLEGGPFRNVTPSLTQLAPTFDGTRYAYAQEIAAKDLPANGPVGYAETEVGVVDTDARQTLHLHRFPFVILKPQPSPTETALVLALGQTSTIATSRSWVLLDLAKGLVLKTMAADGWAAWLPDGRYLRLLGGGELVVGSAAGEESPFGKLSLPLGTGAGPFTINPSGTRMAVRVYSSAGSGGGVDVYLANIDGSEFQRFTKTGWSSYGVWSPDGKYLAFNYDRDVRCGDGVSLQCNHMDCEVHYAPESARDLTIERTQNDAPLFAARYVDGRLVNVPCDIVAWIPSRTPAVMTP